MEVFRNFPPQYLELQKAHERSRIRNPGAPPKYLAIGYQGRLIAFTIVYPQYLDLESRSDYELNLFEPGPYQDADFEKASLHVGVVRDDYDIPFFYIHSTFTDRKTGEERILELVVKTTRELGNGLSLNEGLDLATG